MSNCCDTGSSCATSTSSSNGFFSDKLFILLALASLFAVVLEGLHWAGFEFNNSALLLVAIVYCVTIGKDVFKKGLRDLLKFRFSNINVLMCIAAGAAFALGEYLEVMVVISLFSLGEAMEEKSITASRAEISGLLKNTPKKAQLKNGNFIDITDLKVGDIVIVKTGELIPADGEVVSGQGVVDESSMTGESVPRSKLLHDNVFSGTILLNGYIEIRCAKDPSNFTLAKIIKITFEAAQQKAKLQKFIEKFASYYTPLAIFSALLVFLIPVLFLEGNPRSWLVQALSLLVIACPCSLVISTPLAIYTAVGRAAKVGIVIKGGRVLEALSQVSRVAFDKTRTLTEGKPQVVEVATFNQMSTDEVLACAAGIEKFSEHPLARGIVEAAHIRGIRLHEAKDYHSIIGKGAQARCLICSSEEHFIGNHGFVLEKLTLTQSQKEKISAFESQGKTCVVLWSKDQLEGVIALEDKIRSEAKDAIEEINSLGIQTTMLTGDHLLSAQSIASQLGLSDFQASLLPTDKAEKIKTFEASGDRVAMVGDGVNDAPALITATVGVAMGAAGSDAAIDIAGVALLNDKLDRVPFLLRLSRRCWSVIRFNTLLAVGVKCAALILAVFGLSNLSIAILADVGVTIFVIVITLVFVRSELKVKLL